jgi:hypothetical protein
LTADKFIAAATTAVHFFQQSSISSSYVFSIYAKAGEENVFSMWIANTSKRAEFNLTTGTIPLSTVAKSSIVNVGNGWYRCSVYDSSPTTTYRIYGRTGSSYLGNGVDGIFFWRAQIEAGSYPTSYIPTTTAAVTRNADAISKTGISSLIGQTEGVLFTDFVCDGFQNYGTPLSINDGTTSNYIWLTTFANGNIRAEVYNGAVQASITFTGGVVGQRYKVAFGYKQNDFVMYVNGTQIGTDVSGNVPSSLSRIDYNLVNNWSLALLKVNSSILFPTRLTNAELTQLTTI